MKSVRSKLIILIAVVVVAAIIFISWDRINSLVHQERIILNLGKMKIVERTNKITGASKRYRCIHQPNGYQCVEFRKGNSAKN